MPQSRSLLISLTCLWLLTMESPAQALINDNALITITPGTRVTVLGTALNNGDVVNEGTLSISGDWMNADSYDPRSGLFILNGAGLQNISHNSQDIYQLQVAGGGEKIFNMDLQVMDTLELVDGILSPQAGVILMVLNGGAATGGSDMSYVNGPLFHQGTGSKYFPVGRNGSFRPVELLNITGTNPVVGMEMLEPNSSPQIPFDLLTVSNTRYWRLISQSGIYDGSLIKLKVGADENLGTVDDLGDLAVTGSDAIGSIFTSLGQSQFTGSLLDGEVTSNLPAIGEFYALGVEGFAEERTLFVPNAMSPVAPNPEDRVVKVYGQQVVDSEFMFRIYNRWGKIVYETDSFTEANTVGWTGTSNSGEDESVGVYQYTLTGRFASGNPFRRNGSITVIR